MAVPARREITQSIVWLARTPGCGDLCGDRFGHHAETHERYGAVQERSRASQSTAITTGILTVNFAEAAATVGDRRVPLSPRMWQVLELLARRVGECVRYDEVVRSVWGAEWSATEQASIHNVNVTLHRLRQGVRDAAPLLVTRVGVGVVLLKLPPGDMSGVHLERQKAGGRWSRYHDQCRECGRDDRPHDGHGYCNVCRRWVMSGRPERRDGPWKTMPRAVNGRWTKR